MLKNRPSHFSRKILKYNMLNYWGNPQVPQHPFPKGMDIVNPTPDFRRIAEGMGVAGFKVEDPSCLRDVLDKDFKMSKPCLIDVLLDKSI